MPETAEVTETTATESQETAPDNGSQESEKPAYDAEATAAKAQSRLDALLGDEEAPADAGTDDSEVKEAETDSPNADEDAAEGEANPEGDEEEAAAEKPAEKSGAKENAPTLPAAYRRSLKWAEWTDEEIDNAFQTHGDKFLDYATKIHQSRNQQTEQWAALGRAEREKKNANPGTPAVTDLKPLPVLDATALKNEYGDDKLIDVLIKPLNEQASLINSLLPQIQRMFAVAQETEIDTLARQVESFFGRDEMKPYGELYGTLSENSQLNEKQIAARNTVLELADRLMYGAKAQGKSMSFDKALELAIDSQTGEYKKQAVRQEIKSKLQKRNRGITIKPTGKKGSSNGGGNPKPGDRGALVKKVESRLAKVLGR